MWRRGLEADAGELAWLRGLRRPAAGWKGLTATAWPRCRGAAGPWGASHSGLAGPLRLSVIPTRAHSAALSADKSRSGGGGREHAPQRVLIATRPRQMDRMGADSGPAAHIDPGPGGTPRPPGLCVRRRDGSRDNARRGPRHRHRPPVPAAGPHRTVPGRLAMSNTGTGRVACAMGCACQPGPAHSCRAVCTRGPGCARGCTYECAHEGPWDPGPWPAWPP